MMKYSATSFPRSFGGGGVRCLQLELIYLDLFTFQNFLSSKNTLWLHFYLNLGYYSSVV